MNMTQFIYPFSKLWTFGLFLAFFFFFFANIAALSILIHTTHCMYMGNCSCWLYSMYTQKNGIFRSKVMQMFIFKRQCPSVF